MTIHFVEAEPDSRARFMEALGEHELHFWKNLTDVPLDAKMVSISFSQRIDRAFVETRPNLRFLAARCSGYDHIDADACRERGVTVSYVPSYGENTVAEHTFALMLTLSRRIRELGSAKRVGRFSFEAMRGFDLRGKTLGVIGAGRIGMHVIRLGRAFGMEVVACDTQPSALLPDLLGFTYVSLDELLSRSHVVTLHVPLTRDTLHLLNRETLAKCRTGVLVINTARGAVIDTEALLEALDSGQVAGAGLDVIEDERVFRKEATRVIADQIVELLRSSESPEERHQRDPHRLEEIRALSRNEALLSRMDVVFTPHTAFNSIEATERIEQVTIENIRAFLAGAPKNVVPGAMPSGAASPE
jgi:D-lactate dehydrogenase